MVQLVNIDHVLNAPLGHIGVVHHQFFGVLKARLFEFGLEALFSSLEFAHDLVATVLNDLDFIEWLLLVILNIIIVIVVLYPDHFTW